MTGVQTCALPIYVFSFSQKKKSSHHVLISRSLTHTKPELSHPFLTRTPLRSQEPNNMIYKLWESQLQYLNFFPKIKCKIILEANIDDVILPTLILISQFFKILKQSFENFISVIFSCIQKYGFIILVSWSM